MRRLCSLLLAASLALPAAALARDVTSTDGSLSVAHATGSVILTGKGLLFGHVEHGTVTVLSFKPDGNAVPTVSGAKMKLVGSAINVAYSGNDVRFLFPGGRYSLEIDGTGIDVSAVGRGTIAAVGAGTVDDGSFSADGGPPQRLGFVRVAASWGGYAAGGKSDTSVTSTSISTSTSSSSSNNGTRG